MLLVGTRAGACSAHVRFSIDIGTRITVVVGRVHWLSCCWVSAGHVAVSCMYLFQCNTRRRSFHLHFQSLSRRESRYYFMNMIEVHVAIHH